MITYEEIGRRIRQARQDLGLMQADVGRMLSRPRSHAAVSDIERGKTRLNLEELAEMAQLLQKPLAHFTEPVGTSAIEYRRSERNVPPERRNESAHAIEAFKQRARDRADQARRDRGQ